MGETFVTRVDGPPTEREIARDMARRALPVAPVIVLLAGLVWGAGGAISAGYAMAIVVVNFLLAAWMLTTAARISLSMVMAMALAGYVIRLALIFLAVIVVRNQWWFEPWPLGLTLIVTHLGLLFWETRFVSASPAFPGLHPDAETSRLRSDKETAP